MMIKIIRLDDLKKADEFLSRNFSSPTHWTDWNTVISKNFGTEFFYFAYYEKDEILGLCPVHRIKNKITYRLISGPREYSIPYGGWIFSEEMKFNFSMVKLKSNEMLEIFSLPYLKEFNTNYEGSKNNKLFKTSLINLEQGEEEIWNSISSKRRNMVRKALKNNVELLSLDEIGINDFYEFYVMTNNQYGLTSFKKDFFLDLIEDSKNIHIDFLFARYNSEILGVVILISDKNYSIYWMGARLEDAPNNGFFDLLQWETIKKAKSRKCNYYDLCYLEEDRLPKIYKFKTDYSNNIINILNTNHKSVIYSIINKFQKLI